MSLFDKSTAVVIRNGFKSYKLQYGIGKVDSSVSVLRDFSMSVETGSLYTLLGSSGCGKTTIISCLAGLVKLDHGSVCVFRKENVSRLPKVGYMPQDISLYDHISIYETLAFFGRIFNMTDKGSDAYTNLGDKIEYLRKLLNLPDGKRIVGTLSGGQRKRVSFAVAVVHQPKLLLLDEPTAGVDPLIRECIWKFLRTLAASHGTTIILTTHYVDEAKGSDVVGIMREGQLIAQENPQSLMERFQDTSLERTFFRLSLQQQSELSPALSNVLVSHTGTNPELYQSTASTVEAIGMMRITTGESAARIWALMIKNYKCMFRNFWMLLFITLIPAMCMFVTCITFRHEPSSIPFGVVNHDIGSDSTDGGKCLNISEKGTCDIDQLGCKFINHLPSNAMSLKFFASTDFAKTAVEKGVVWGYLFFPKNYSRFLTQRHMLGAEEYKDDEHESEKIWNGSQITVSMDQTNTLISGAVKTILYNAVEESFKKLAKECGLLDQIAEFPLQYRDPIVGSIEMSTLDYIAPGLAIGILFFFPLTVAVRFISEKRQGTMARCVVGGTQVWEILLAYSIPEFFILLVQTILVQLIIQYGFRIGISIHSFSMQNCILTLILCMLQGLAGLSSGLLLAVLCTEEGQAALTIIAIIFPSSFISGVLWPLEGMPKVLQVISPVFPMTLPGEALRSLMIRGWSIDNPNVWKGFGATLLYIFIPYVITVVITKKQMQG